MREAYFPQFLSLHQAISILEILNFYTLLSVLLYYKRKILCFYSYICPKCNTNIRSNYSNGEDAILFHIRGGKVLGYGVGMYNGYGRLVPDADFRNNRVDNINSHEEILNI